LAAMSDLSEVTARRQLARERERRN